MFVIGNCFTWNNCFFIFYLIFSAFSFKIKCKKAFLGHFFKKNPKITKIWYFELAFHAFFAFTYIGRIFCLTNDRLLGKTTKFCKYKSTNHIKGRPPVVPQNQIKEGGSALFHVKQSFLVFISQKWVVFGFFSFQSWIWNVYMYYSYYLYPFLRFFAVFLSRKSTCFIQGMWFWSWYNNDFYLRFLVFYTISQCFTWNISEVIAKVFKKTFPVDIL